MQTSIRLAVAQVAEDHRHVQQLKDSARKQKDVIKLNCINDKLLQIRELAKIARTARTEFDQGMAAAVTPALQHLYSMMSISRDKTQALREEAATCIGDEINYLGPSALDSDEPEVPDDPTDDDPFDPDAPGNEIEPPGYASPFE